MIFQDLARLSGKDPVRFLIHAIKGLIQHISDVALPQGTVVTVLKIT